MSANVMETTTTTQTQTLINNVICVFGCCGNVGSGIAAAYLSRGYTVAAICEDAKCVKAPLNKLIDSPRLLLVEEPQLDQYVGMQRSLKAITDKFGENCIKSVVSCFGQYFGIPTTPLYSLTDETAKYYTQLAEANRPHLFAWAVYGRFLLEKNLPGCSYFVVTGSAGADGNLGVLSVGLSIQQGISRVCTHECAGTNVEFRELRIDDIMIEDDDEYAKMQAEGRAATNLRDSSWFGRVVPVTMEALAPISRMESSDFREKVRYQDAHVINFTISNFDSLLQGQAAAGALMTGQGKAGGGVSGMFSKAAETLSHVFTGSQQQSSQSTAHPAHPSSSS